MKAKHILNRLYAGIRYGSSNHLRLGYLVGFYYTNRRRRNKFGSRTNYILECVDDWKERCFQQIKLIDDQKFQEEIEAIDRERAVYLQQLPFIRRSWNVQTGENWYRRQLMKDMDFSKDRINAEEKLRKISGRKKYLT